MAAELRVRESMVSNDAHEKQSGYAVEGIGRSIVVLLGQLTSRRHSSLKAPMCLMNRDCKRRGEWRVLSVMVLLKTEEVWF